MFSTKLSLCFICLIFAFDLREADDPCNALGEFGWEVRRGDDVLECSLRIGSNDAYSCRRRGVQRIREWNLGGFEPSAVGYMTFGGECQPDRSGIDIFFDIGE